MNDPAVRRAARLPPTVAVYVALLAAAAALVALAVAPQPALVEPPWLALPVLAILLVAATWFVVPFRYGASVDAVNLIEAVLAPLIVAFPPVVVMLVAAVSQTANGLLRRLDPVKTVFNTAMWALAGGLGAAVFTAAGGGPAWPNRVLALLVALLVVGAVNTVALAAVLALAEGGRLRALARAFVPVMRLGWLGGWLVNAAVGMLFALAMLASPVAAPLFGIPLLVLHLASRSYSMAKADQTRLAAAHRAAGALAAPLQPLEGVADFLHELAVCFDAGAAELVLRVERGREIHRVERGGDYEIRREEEGEASLEGLLAASAVPVRASQAGADPISRALAAHGAHDCLAAPLLDGDRIVGAVLVLDLGGFAGSRAGELGIFEALAREASAALAKGRLLADVLEERRKLAEIVDSASDGICTFAADGTVLTWNPALEQITGLRAEEAVGRADVLRILRVRTPHGRPVRSSDRGIAALPREIRLTTRDGTVRHLTCSYSAGATSGTATALVVVARDVTPVEEHEALREQLSRLLEDDAARRVVVEQLQQTVVPAPIRVPGAEIAAAYEASDPREPTGGDLYDWQVLPSGEVHVAVVDVLGHGVAATKDALAVVHTLRLLTASGAPLEELIARADELLRAQHPDLVATVIVARYSPDSGLLRVAAGGHPPALLITPRGEVSQVAASGGVIGWPNAGSDIVSETVLQPGDALVLYTDGLVEARKNILDGMDALLRHASEVAELPAAQLARELVERALAGAERRDDTLALVLRRDPARVADLRTVWETAPDPAQVPALRRAFGEWLRRRDVQAHEPLIVAGELLANAVRVARSRVVLQVELRGGDVVVTVSDDGPGAGWLDAEGRRLPSPEHEQGRGLYLVRALSRRVDVLSTAEGSTVRAVMPAGGSSAAPKSPRPGGALPVRARRT